MLAVYIGHPGWKAMGGRIGYSFGTGVMVIVLCWLGIVPLILALVPVVAILPILLYIGMLIGSQAFQETPRSHAPAILLAMVPNLAAWGLNQVNGALTAAGVARRPSSTTALASQGVLLHGLEVLGGGAALSGIVLGAATVFIIERKPALGRGVRGGRRGASPSSDSCTASAWASPPTRTSRQAIFSPRSFSRWRQRSRGPRRSPRRPHPLTTDEDRAVTRARTGTPPSHRGR